MRTHVRRLEQRVGGGACVRLRRQHRLDGIVQLLRIYIRDFLDFSANHVIHQGINILCVGGERTVEVALQG